VSETIFFRLLEADDKEHALTGEIAATRSEGSGSATYRVHQDTFKMMPGATFGYWASDDVRGIFSRLKPLEADSRRVRVGLQTSDDFRFVRAVWEVDPDAVVRADNDRVGRWAPFAKGGDFAPFHGDVHLVVNWWNEGAELRIFETAYIRNERLYFRPGLTWTPRTLAGLSVRIMPNGCAFSHKGPAIFAEDQEELVLLLALLNSKPGRSLVDLQMAVGSFEAGVLQRLPIPETGPQDRATCVKLARRIHDVHRNVDTTNETSHVFILPAVLRSSEGTVRKRLDAWNQIVSRAGVQIREDSCRIDEVLYQLYGFSDQDRATADQELGRDVKGLPHQLPPQKAAADVVSWSVGVAVGRFDVRLATGERPIPELRDPFEPLPVYSPGMLPEWRVPAGYPLTVDADGILVDDEGHEDDIVRRVDQVFDLLWKEQSGALQQELCTLLGVSSLRDWFRRTGAGGFWDDHFKRYSKSRRNAPIYWPLQSPRGLYIAWVYYHHLDRDTLPKLLGPKYLGGKIERVRQAIAELRPQDGSKRVLSRQQEKRLGELDELLADLEQFAARIQQIIRLQNDRAQTVGWAPDLDDGVVLNAAPLHALIPWPRKKKRGGKSVSELLAFWQDLEDGKYDWAHIAMRYWPERVTAKCREDRSLALAHGLDREFFPGLREELREAAARAATEDSDMESDAALLRDAEDQEDDE